MIWSSCILKMNEVSNIATIVISNSSFNVFSTTLCSTSFAVVDNEFVEHFSTHKTKVIILQTLKCLLNCCLIKYKKVFLPLLLQCITPDSIKQWRSNKNYSYLCGSKVQSEWLIRRTRLIKATGCRLICIYNERW